MDPWSQPIAWRATGDTDAPWEADVAGANWVLRVHHFPEGPNEDWLHIDGVPVAEFNTWPASWSPASEKERSAAQRLRRIENGERLRLVTAHQSAAADVLVVERLAGAFVARTADDVWCEPVTPASAAELTRRIDAVAAAHSDVRFLSGLGPSVNADPFDSETLALVFHGTDAIGGEWETIFARRTDGRFDVTTTYHTPDPAGFTPTEESTEIVDEPTARARILASVRRDGRFPSLRPRT